MGKSPRVDMSHHKPRPISEVPSRLKQTFQLQHALRFQTARPGIPTPTRPTLTPPPPGHGPASPALYNAPICPPALSKRNSPFYRSVGRRGWPNKPICRAAGRRVPKSSSSPETCNGPVSQALSPPAQSLAHHLPQTRRFSVTV